MSSHRQSVRSFPCSKQPYLLEYDTYMVKLEILTQSKALTPNKLKIQATWLIKRHIGSFRIISDSFQDHCLNHHRFHILDSIWCISCQNICQPLNFKFLNLLCPSRPIVATYEQIWLSVKIHKKHGNFHNKSGSPLKLTPEVTPIGTHIVSKSVLYSYY